MFCLENLLDEKDIHISLPPLRDVWPTYVQGHKCDNLRV